MKKTITLVICLLMALTVLAGCGKSADAGEPVKLGLAVVTSLGSSKSATGEAAGLGQVDSTVVAVTIDANGKIVKCVIDAAQTKINFDANGKITSDKTKEIKTKQELGNDYNMKGKSGIQKEWFEQANAFAAYVVGKTVAEVKGIALNESGAPTGSDLTGSVTIHVNDFIAAIEKAAANAKDLGARANDKLGLGIVTSISDSKDAAEDAAGLAQAYTYYTATTYDAKGKITASVIDASQGKINFDTTGQITSDLNAEVKTKQELGFDYNMKDKSGIQKEWFEQANAFAEYIKGKTAAEVKGISLNQGVPADADLKSSVTVHVTDFLTAIEKSSKNAK